jgi:oligogalacturonide lyase
MITRRHFLAGLGMLGAGALYAPRTAFAAAEGPFESYADPVTGARVRMLTDNQHQDRVVYQTHPQWAHDQSLLRYNSQRNGAWVPVALDMNTGENRVLVEAAVPEVLDVPNDRLVYIHNRAVYALPFAMLPAEPVKLAEVPGEVQSIVGGLFMDAVQPVLYAGALKEADTKWALMACNLEDGTWSTVCDLDFQIGHVQANPVKTGEIMFCHETGGDAPQRMWMVEVGGEPRPAYEETYDEWVTHEVWWGQDHAVFTIWPYDNLHLELPHGILSVNVRTGASTLHNQYKAWHVHASPDRKWIVGDDFDRNLWLIRVDDGERRLLTQGHRTQGFDTHPHMSFTPDSKAIVFSSSRNGSDSVFLVDVPEFDTLPKP